MADENPNPSGQRSYLSDYLTSFQGSSSVKTAGYNKVTFSPKSFKNTSKQRIVFPSEYSENLMMDPVSSKKTHIVLKKKISNIGINMVAKTEGNLRLGNNLTRESSSHREDVKEKAQVVPSPGPTEKISLNSFGFTLYQKRNSDYSTKANETHTFFTDSTNKTKNDLESSATFQTQNNKNFKFVKPGTAHGGSRAVSLKDEDAFQPTLHSYSVNQKLVISTAPNFIQYSELAKKKANPTHSQEKNEILLKTYTPQYAKKRPASSVYHSSDKMKAAEENLGDINSKEKVNNKMQSSLVVRNTTNEVVKVNYKITDSGESLELVAPKDNFTQLLSEYNTKAYDQQLSEIKSTLKSMRMGRLLTSKTKEPKSLKKIKGTLFDLSGGRDQPLQDQGTPLLQQVSKENKGTNGSKKNVEEQSPTPRNANGSKKLDNGTTQKKEESAEKAFFKPMKPKPGFGERCRTSGNTRIKALDISGLNLFSSKAPVEESPNKSKRGLRRRSGAKKQDSSVEALSNSAIEAVPKQSLPLYYVDNLRKYWTKYDENDPFCRLYRDHFYQLFKELKVCKRIRPTDIRTLAKKKVSFAQRESHKDKKTLIFDLDETLIHCNPSLDTPCDVVLPIKFEDGSLIRAGINIRPYAVECLREMSRYYEIMVFTASHSCYANVILDYLDPQKEYIHHRLFRESCIATREGPTIKDLRIIQNRNLSDIILVDNSGNSFGYQVDNGVPIIPFFNNKRDHELLDLMEYLKSICFEPDLRVPNRQTFKLSAYSKFNSPKEVLDKVVFQN